jgi:chromosome segregation ATPase
MSKFRARLENYVVRQTSDVVDDLPKERRQELAEVLHDLEGYSPRAAEAERRTEELVEKLDNRNASLDKARARIEGLEQELAQAEVDAGTREQRMAAELEVERVRIAEREQTFRDEITAREREVVRRIEILEGREAEFRYTESRLLELERNLGLFEAELDNRAQELEARSDERLAAREVELDQRERQIEVEERRTAEDKRRFESRAIHVTELERRSQLRIDSVEERESQLIAARKELERRSAALAEREADIDRRKREFDAYVRSVQGSFYSDR